MSSFWILSPCSSLRREPLGINCLQGPRDLHRAIGNGWRPSHGPVVFDDSGARSLAGNGQHRQVVATEGHTPLRQENRTSVDRRISLACKVIEVAFARDCAADQSMELADTTTNAGDVRHASTIGSQAAVNVKIDNFSTSLDRGIVMNIGIIGAGHIGGSLTRRLAAVGHTVWRRGASRGAKDRLKLKPERTRSWAAARRFVS